MIITDYQVQHVLKSYSQQLSVRSRISREKIHGNNGQRDEVTLSSESKKKIMVDKITREFVNQLATRPERDEMTQRVLNRLSQEFGQPLDVEPNHGEILSFKVVDETGRGVPEHLSPVVNEHLSKRLFDITQSFVYEQIKGEGV